MFPAAGCGVPPPSVGLPACASPQGMTMGQPTECSWSMGMGTLPA
jgi:hypothetical protein